MKDILKGNKLVFLTTAVFAVILILTLFVFRYGVSDNGDLTGRLEQLGLYDAYYQNAGSGEYPTEFKIGNVGIWNFQNGFSTADLPYMAAKFIFRGNLSLSFVPSVYVAVPAILYGILLLLGVFLILKNLLSKYNWNNILLSVLCLLIFADSGYTAFLNTPYIDAASFVYLIFAVGALLWATCSDKGVLPILIAGVGCLLFSGVSVITGWIGILMAIYFVHLFFAKKQTVQKVLSIVCALATVCTSVSVIYLSVPQENKLFDSVFYGAALEDSTNAEVLGFDKETTKKYAGKASFEAESAEYLAQNTLGSKVSYKDISLFYLMHPSVALENLEKVANNSVMISTDYLGNYPYGSGRGLKPGVFFKVYSGLKRRLIPANFWIMLLLWIALIVGTVFYRKKYAESADSKLICDLIVLGVLASVIAFLLPLILGGLVQIGFYMHLYNLLFDFCLIAILVGGSKLLWKRREALKEKYGVNQ